MGLRGSAAAGGAGAGPGGVGLQGAGGSPVTWYICCVAKYRTCTRWDSLREGIPSILLPHILCSLGPPSRAPCANLGIPTYCDVLNLVYVLTTPTMRCWSVAYTTPGTRASFGTRNCSLALGPGRRVAIRCRLIPFFCTPDSLVHHFSSFACLPRAASAVLRGDLRHRQGTACDVRTPGTRAPCPRPVELGGCGGIRVKVEAAPLPRPFH